MFPAVVAPVFPEEFTFICTDFQTEIDLLYRQGEGVRDVASPRRAVEVTLVAYLLGVVSE